VLVGKCGVRLDPRRPKELNYKDPGLLFIHGILTGTSKSSGVTVSVLYAAVGRRLGYPLRLVQAKNYLFLRWDDPKTKERFNVEITPKGLQCPQDEHYKTWPAKLSEAELASGRFLRPLTGAEEMAAFLAMRGHCLLDTGHGRRANRAYAFASDLAPGEPSYLAWLAESLRRQTGGAFLASGGPKDPRGPAAGAGGKAQGDPLAELRRIEAINEQNRRRMGLPTGRPSLGTPGLPHVPTAPPSPHTPPRPGGPPNAAWQPVGRIGQYE